MTPAPVEHWRAGTAVGETTAAVFAGRLVVFRDLTPMQQLVRRACSLVADVLGTADLEDAERMVDPTRFRELAVKARNRVARDAELNRNWRECLAAVGFDPASVHTDRVRLRVVPSAPAAQSRIARPLPAHRDTWGSGIEAQINWWLPLHSLTATRTMLVWPDLFRQPIANDSAEWVYDASRDAAYPLLPSARERPPTPGQPVLIEPGELLAFSAAHLHAGVADASGFCRVSIDTRTVWNDDVAAGHGAPNVDGAAPTERWEWFQRRWVSQ